MVGEIWPVDPGTNSGATLAVSSTLRASSMLSIAEDDLPGGPADKGETVLRAYVFVSPARADEVVASFDPFLWGGTAAVVSLIAAAAAVASKRSLKPVERMRVAAAGITGAPDGIRVDVPTADDELHALALTLNHMLERIDDAARRQRRFIADAAHELRSPLNTLLATVEIAQTHPDALPPERTLQQVEAEARRLVNLTEDLLTLASTRGTRPAGDDTCDAAAIVRHVADTQRADIALTVTAQRDPLLVAISETALIRVVRNLLDNAVRHAATRVEVRLDLDPDTHAACIHVTNDGEPIPEHELERIFQPFVRLDVSRTRDTGGAGLGLSITHEILDRAGGTLTVSSVPSRTRFTATMRLAR